MACWGGLGLGWEEVEGLGDGAWEGRSEVVGVVREVVEEEEDRVE